MSKHKMSKAQHEHVHKLMFTMAMMMEKKYTAGQKEHGGNLWEMSEEELLNNALDEVVDLGVYLLTLRDKLFPGE